MSAPGRCAGCGETGPVKAVSFHLLGCAAWATLYVKDRAAALGASEEHARWLVQDAPAAHAADLAGRVADTQDRRRASIARFRVDDPLEDDGEHD